MSESTFSANADKHVIYLPFSIGQRVHIKAIEKVAVIYSICISRDGMEFCVKWWNDETRHEAWMRALELEAA